MPIKQYNFQSTNQLKEECNQGGQGGTPIKQYNFQSIVQLFNFEMKKFISFGMDSYYQIQPKNVYGSKQAVMLNTLFNGGLV